MDRLAHDIPGRRTVEVRPEGLAGVVGVGIGPQRLDDAQALQRPLADLAGMNGERKGVVVVIAKINVDLPATEKTIEFGRPSLQLSPGNKAREETRWCANRPEVRRASIKPGQQSPGRVPQEDLENQL